MMSEEIRGILRVIVILASAIALLFHCGLFCFSYMRIAYGVDGVTTERLTAFLRPGRIALFLGAPITFAAFIATVNDYKRFHWVAFGALVAFVGVIVSLNIFLVGESTSFFSPLSAVCG